MAGQESTLTKARAQQPAEIRLLSVRQPFTWAIAYAAKTPENRGRRTAYRGLVAVHAGLELAAPGFFPRNEAGREAARALDRLGGRSNFWDARWTYIGGGLRHPGMALGAVIAIAELAGCHPAAECQKLGADGTVSYCTPWAASGGWHWELASTRPLSEPVACRGSLVLWPLPEPLRDAVLDRAGQRARAEEER